MIYSSHMDKIDILLNRAVEQIYPSKEALEKVLRSGKRLRVYQGFDPTSTQLHLGHLIGLRKLSEWQELGHEVIFLIGDFTATIGDPSGKSESRKLLEHKEVLKNSREYKNQAGRILKFSGPNPVKIKYNSQWLAKLTAADFLRLTHYFSAQQIIKRDLFQERFKSGKDLFMNEFLYPILQAYDCVVMNIDVEIGGSDQLFNMLAGRDLMHKMKRKDKFVVTTPLLTDASGKKIGKTEKNSINLTDEPRGLFAKIMSLGDEVIIKGLEYLTNVPLSEIERVKERIKAGENPMIFKKRLAFEIVKSLNSEAKAKEAQLFFEQIYQQQKIDPTNLQTIFIKNQTTLTACLTKNFGFSKSAVKRLTREKAIDVNKQTISDPDFLLRQDDVVKVGKHKIFKVKTV